MPHTKASRYGRPGEGESPKDYRTFRLAIEEWALVTNDLHEARGFLWKLQTVDSDDYDSWTVRRALTMSAIVAYCRPFKTSRDADNKRKPWVPSELIDDLPEALRGFHEQAIRARDQEWAHTDWEAHTPKVSVEEKCYRITSRNPWVSLNKREIERFLELILEIEKRLPIPPSSMEKPSEERAE